MEEQPKRGPGRPTKKEVEERERRKLAILGRPAESVVELPFGYKIECFSTDEEEDVKRDIQPYLDRAASIPADTWPHLHRMFDAMMKLRRVGKEIDRLQVSPAADRDLLNERIRWQNHLHKQIQDISAKFDVLKQDTGSEENPAEVLATYKQAALDYCEQHPGEFEWQCPHCLRFNICEVPHYAYDTAAGPRVIWNQEVAEQVKRHYSWKNRFENALKLLPDNARKALAEPHFREILAEAGGLSIVDAANVLRISPIGLLATARLDREFDFGVAYDLDKPETLAPLVMSKEEADTWIAEYRKGNEVKADGNTE